MVEDTQNPLEGSTPEAQEAVNSLQTKEEALEPNGSDTPEPEASTEPDTLVLAPESEESTVEPTEELTPQEDAPAAEAPAQDVLSVESEPEEAEMVAEEVVTEAHETTDAPAVLEAPAAVDAPDVIDIPVVLDAPEALDAPAALEESDSHTEEEREAHEDHQADYSELSDEALVAEAARVLREVPIVEARLPMLALRNTLLPRLDEVRQNALDKFIAEGGVAMDFRFEQKIRESFFATFNEFKKRRTAWKSEQTLALTVNLDLKKAIVNELKALSGNEDLPDRNTYTKFKSIFDRWKEVGPVPAEDARDLNATFRFLVDRFYDNLRLSQELREMDYKVNKEAKEMLIRAIKELSVKNWSASVGLELQHIHTAWKEIGPVSLDQKEPLWEEFKAASAVLHEKRRIKFDEQKAQNGQRLEAKIAKIAEAEALRETLPTSHKAWEQVTEKLNELRTELGKIGRTFGGSSDELWNRFKAVDRWAYKERSTFYRDRKKLLKGALDVKMQIVLKAEALAGRTDFAEASKEMKQLQQEWKDSGFAPKKATDDLWARFRAAGNVFFDNLRGAHGEERAVKQVAYRQAQGNQSARQAIELARRKFAQMENNMGFFQYAKPDSPIVQDALKKVEQARKELELAEKAFAEYQKAERAKTASSLAPESGEDRTKA